jgi:hypothetical protein
MRNFDLADTASSKTLMVYSPPWLVCSELVLVGDCPPPWTIRWCYPFHHPGPAEVGEGLTSVSKIAMKARALIWIAAILTLIVAIIQLTTAIMENSSYTKLTKQYQAFTDEVAKKVVDDINSKSPNTQVGHPIIMARAVGPDIKIEASYEINVDSHASTLGDNTGKIDALITDYGPGKYRIEEAHNAQVAIDVLRQSIDNFLKDKIEGFEIDTEVLGGADGIPIRPGAAYSGDLGPIIDVPFYSYDTKLWKRMTLLPGTSQHTNESIAFLRALDVCRKISDVESLRRSKMAISTSTTSRIGGSYRKVIVRIVVKKALEKEYNELSPLAHLLFLDKSESPGS